MLSCERSPTATSRFFRRTPSTGWRAPPSGGSRLSISTGSRAEARSSRRPSSLRASRRCWNASPNFVTAPRRDACTAAGPVHARRGQSRLGASAGSRREGRTRSASVCLLSVGAAADVLGASRGDRRDEREPSRRTGSAPARGRAGRDPRRCRRHPRRRGVARHAVDRDRRHRSRPDRSSRRGRRSGEPHCTASRHTHNPYRSRRRAYARGNRFGRMRTFPPCRSARDCRPRCRDGRAGCGRSSSDGDHGTVSAVGGTSATLNGTVNPGGAATDWWFEYGTSTSYGSKSATTAAGSGSANVAVSKALSGLAPATTYHYRLVAKNATGDHERRRRAFHDRIASSRRHRTCGGRRPDDGDARRHGEPERRAHDVVRRIRNLDLVRQEDARRPMPARAASRRRSRSASRAAAGKTYHFRLVATSSAGTVQGADATFVTAEPPAATTSAASSVGSTERDAERQGRPERAGDHLRLRVRHDDLVRDEDPVFERRIGLQRGERLEEP